MKSNLTDQEFINLWTTHMGVGQRVADAAGIALRNVMYRRRRIEEKLGEPLLAGRDLEAAVDLRVNWARRSNIEINKGTVVVFSDAHYMPGQASRAHRGLLKVIADVQPDWVIGNGDLLEGGSISRHPPLGWTGKKVSVKDELDVLKERLGEISDAAKKANPKVQIKRTRGNHCARFDIFLATNAAQFEGVEGFSLADHIPEWEESMSIMVNDGTGVTPTMIKHRYHNGTHAAYNNLKGAGTHIVTGHLHRLKEDRWGDYRGRRYSVDTGSLAEKDGPEFAYSEDNPSPWGSGFAVLTFHKHHMLPPELAEVVDDIGLVFRSHVYEV